MSERAGLFDDNADLDLSAFAPKKPSARPETEAIRAISEKANFRSREPVQAKSPKKADRRHRTGRNIQLNTKVDESTERLLYEIYDAHRGKENWTLGEIIGLALQSLQRELASKS